MIIWSRLLNLLMLLIHLHGFAALNIADHLISLIHLLEFILMDASIQVIEICMDVLGDVVSRVLGYLVELSSEMLRVSRFIHLIHLLRVDQVCLVGMIDSKNLVDFFVSPVVTN
jgi:hypothetical protein